MAARVNYGQNEALGGCLYCMKATSFFLGLTLFVIGILELCSVDVFGVGTTGAWGEIGSAFLVWIPLFQETCEEDHGLTGGK